MKVVKKIILIIISIFVMGIRVEAATNDTGICYKKKAVETGYCELNDPVQIYSEEFAYHPLKFTDGSSASTYNYYGKIEGENQDMFCIDPNLGQPKEQKYKYARSFDIQTDYDRAIAKIYTLYVNDVVYVMNSQGKSFEEASINYIQAANVAMRAITTKYGYDIKGTKTIKENHFDNVCAQFERKSTPSPKLVDSPTEFKLAQRYYCSALITCKTCEHVDATAKANCASLDKVSKTDIPKFDVKIQPTSKVENIDSGNSSTFARIIEVKITGLKEFVDNYDAYAKTNPYFKVKNIYCEDKNLDCKIESGITLNTDILKDLNGDEYTFKVKISGKKANFLTETAGKLTVEYEYHHVLNSNNLAVLRYHLTEQYRQRMIVLMPKRIDQQDLSISFPIPAICQTEIVNNKQKYIYDSKEVSELEYLQSGCCNINPAYLKDSDALNYYFKSCGADSQIKLVTKCDNTTDEPSLSYIIQTPIEQVINNITNLYKNRSQYSASDFNNQLKKYQYFKDDNYLYNPSENDHDAISKDNTYCQMFTSEKQYISYPSVAEATSGRFFVFKQQPYILGEVEGIFYTDVDRWSKDFDIALKLEKDFFKALQDAKNDEDITDLTPYQEAYNSAQRERQKIQNYKSECERKSDLVNKWKYYFEPELTFYYEQEYFDTELNKKNKVVEKVPMKISYQAEKYWPNESDKTPILTKSSTKKGQNRKIISYPGYSEDSFAYDTTEQYQIGYKQTLYYIPSEKYFSLIPNGKYVTNVNQYDATNLLDVGYVFNVKLTTYKGEYTTWFTVNHLGHLMQSPKIKPKSISNLQAVLNQYLLENKNILNIADQDKKIDGSEFVNKCIYKDKEILYKRDCATCEDDNKFEVQYYSKIVSNENLFPNEGVGDRTTGANWSGNLKGQTARANIQAAGNDIYSDTDGSERFLELSVIMTPTKLNKIRKYNKQNDYTDFKLKCRFSGKECVSELLTELVADDSKLKSILENNRANGWKYFIKEKWERSSIATLFNGSYPEDNAGLPYWP